MPNSEGLLTNNEIVEDVIRRNTVQQCLKYYPQHNELREDLVQYIYLKLLEYDNGKLNDAYRKGKMLGLISWMMRYSISPTSEFYRIHKAFSFKALPFDINRDDISDE